MFRRRGEHYLYEGDRVINFRPVFFGALAMGAGIASFWFFGLAALWADVLLAPVFLIALCLKIFKRKAVFGVMLFAAFLCCLYSVGVLSLSMRISYYESSPVISDYCAVTGEIAEIGERENGLTITLDNLEVVLSETAEELTLSGKMTVYLSGEAQPRIGMRAMFVGYVETVDVCSYGRINTSAVIANARYRSFVSAEEFILLGEGRFDLFNETRAHIREVLFDGLDEQTASVAYAMLTGNSAFMDEDLLQNFRYGGIAHIFAVSGLHIGLVCGLLLFLLKKFRVPAVVRVPIIFVCLLFYSGVCGFSPSSVRALVMCTVVLATDAAGIGHDKLTNVSLAAIVVLTVNPVHLFSVGFQLSLAAAAGILVLGGELARLLREHTPVPRKIGSALSVSFSAQVATFPVLIDCFGYVPALSFFLNLLFVPLIGAVYTVLFFGAVLAFLFPFAAAFLLYIPGFLLELAVLPVYAFEFKVLLICGFSFGALCAGLWYLIGFLLSDKVNLRAFPKLCGVSALSLVFVLCMLVRNALFPFDAVLTVHSYYGSDVAILREGGQITLVFFSEPDESHLEQLMLEEGIRSLDNVLFLTDADTLNFALPVLLEYADVDRVLLCEDTVLPDSFQSVEIVQCEGFFSLGDAQAYYLDESTLYLNVNGSEVLLCSSYAGGMLPACDLLVSETDDDELAAACGAAEWVTFAKNGGNLSVYDAGDLQIMWKDAIICIGKL